MQKKAARENSHRIGETFCARPTLQRFFFLLHNRVYVRLALSGIFAHELNLLTIGYAASRAAPGRRTAYPFILLSRASRPKLVRDVRGGVVEFGIVLPCAGRG